MSGHQVPSIAHRAAAPPADTCIPGEGYLDRRFKRLFDKFDTV